MAGDRLPIDVVALHGLVNGVSVVNDKGDAPAVPAVGADGNVVPVTENHDVAGLPLGRVVQVAGQHLSMTAEEGIQIADPAEVDIAVRRLNVGVTLRMGGNVRIYQVLQRAKAQPRCFCP